MSIFATFKFSVQNGRCRKGFSLALLLWVVEISLFHAKPAYIITNAVTERAYEMKLASVDVLTFRDKLLRLRSSHKIEYHDFDNS